MVETIGGAKWIDHSYADADGFLQSTSSSPIAVNGMSVAVAVKPKRNTTGTSWTSIVDLFYNRVVLGVRNSTGKLDVWRNGTLYTSAAAIPDGQITILSLVIQSDGQLKAYANGVLMLSTTATSAMTSLVPNVPGGYANALNVGRNNPDGWTAFNGHIGDVFVHKAALTDAERQQLEADLAAKFQSTDYTITASAGAGGTINPSGSVSLPPGGSQTFTLTPQPDYVVSSLVVNGVTRAAAGSYTFSNVTTAQSISATFTLSPAALWKQIQFGTNANNPLIAGDLADPDNDRISNLLERAMAMNPNASDPVPISIDKSATTLDFIYTKNKSATDLTYSVEWSDTLANDWTTTGVSAPTILSDNGTTQRIKVTAPAGPGITKRFTHLKVTHP